MHLPDGFLTPHIWISAWLASLGGLSYCFRKTALVLKDRMIPLMGVMSAFIFAAQMINFPVAGGTSGHLLGGVLAAVLLGPYAAAVVISVVLMVQCLIFQDGGLTALGANIFNMSFAGAMGGYAIYAFIRRFTPLETTGQTEKIKRLRTGFIKDSKPPHQLHKLQRLSHNWCGGKGILIATAIASWMSIVLASLFCAAELAFSGLLPLKAALTAMILVHALIGIGEAVLTCLVVSFVLKVRPDLLYKL